MAFAATGWVCTDHGAGASKVFFYKSNDLFTAIDDSDYFLGVYDQLSVGDVIIVSSDIDGSPLPGMLSVTAASSSTVTTTPLSTATITLYEPIRKDVNVPAIGTAETVYVHAGVPTGFIGTVSRVTGVSHTNGAGSGGTSTITITVPTTGAIATLPFLQDYTAGTLIEDSSITAHTALDEDGVITIATDGTGSHTDAAIVSLELTLSVAP
jgi:hypothetical protein